MAPVLRWALPISLLLAEGMGISLLIDLPTAGEAAPLVAALRLAIPVLIGGGAAGWLIARRPEPVALAGALPPPGPWRPAPLLALNLAAYAVLAWLAWRLMGDGAPPPGLAALSGWVAWAAVTVLLALGSAAPLAWSLRLLRERWRLPLLALAAGMLVWRAAAAAEGLWGVLTGSTLHAVGWMVGVLRHDAILDAGEAVVGAGRFEVAIAPVCSGVNGIGLVAVFQSLWIALARSRLRFPRALLLLPAGALLAFAANVVRITLLVLLGAAGLERVAWASFHSKLGWLLFIAIALGSVAAAERVAWLRREPSGEAGGAAEPAVPAAAAAYIAPLLAALAAALLLGAFGSGLPARWYGLPVAAAALVLLAIRGQLPRPRLGWSLPAVALGAAVGVLWVLLARGEPGAAGVPAGLGPGARGAWIAVRVLGSCAVIPVVEELAFRGFLLPWLTRPDFEALPARAVAWPAVLLSSLAFGALHQHWILGTAAGLAFALARWHRGRLGDAILAHAAANAAIALAVLLGGRWDLWS